MLYFDKITGRHLYFLDIQPVLFLKMLVSGTLLRIDNNNNLISDDYAIK